tara:strand:+ start:58821 stop:60095 length:1275 start_codon:yes stop_codon:yes gene_type:complete
MQLRPPTSIDLPIAQFRNSYGSRKRRGSAQFFETETKGKHVRRILILCTGDIAKDARVDRQVRNLSADYEICCIASGPPTIPIWKFIQLPQPYNRQQNRLVGRAIKLWTKGLLSTQCYERHYWGQSWVKAIDSLAREDRVDLVIANDLDALPVGLRVGQGAPVLFDAHEFYPEYPYFPPETTMGKLWKSYMQHLLQKYCSQASTVMTVSEEIADLYRQNFDVSPTVLVNYPDRAELRPQPVLTERISLVHHGASQASRGIELLIDTMELLDDRFVLNLILMGDPQKGYLARLHERCKENPKVIFHSPVPVQAIPSRINHYDLGVFLLPQTNLHYQTTLPNKFFDFVQGRLGIAIGPQTAMGRLVREHQLGVVAETCSAASLAKSLNSLTREDIEGFKRHSDQIANSWTNEKNKTALLELVQRLI